MLNKMTKAALTTTLLFNVLSTSTAQTGPALMLLQTFTTRPVPQYVHVFYTGSFQECSDAGAVQQFLNNKQVTGHYEERTCTIIVWGNGLGPDGAGVIMHDGEIRDADF